MNWAISRAVGVRLIAFLMLPVLPAWGQAITSVNPPIVPRGTPITLVGTLPAETVFWLPPEELGTSALQPYDCTANTPMRTRLVAPPPVPVPVPVPTETSGVTTFTFTVLVPASLALGDYTLCASFPGANGAQWYTVPVLGDSGRLQVIDPSDAPDVQVTSVPRVVYPGNDGRYTFSVLGNGFSGVAVDNAVLLNGRELAVCWNGDGTCSNDPLMAQGSAISTHELILDLPAASKDLYVGSQTLQVRVGRDNVNPSNGAPSITLAHISKNAPLWMAAGVVGVLLGVVLGILGTRKSGHTIAGIRLSLLSTLLLDKATDTYSLSRAQFYAWTSAAVFGYSYLTVAWTFLQGRLEFAPVPQNLPGIILASAGTAVFVEGISRGKPKGAGDMHPSLADFISTGGMVVPERLQFFVWTVIGVATFVLLLVQSDPATIATLPAIPTDFLTLMGISSAGYLGGRLVRKGGPVIDDILAVLGTLHLEIHGRFLSKNASFQIDGEDVALHHFGSGSDADRLPTVVSKDEDAQDPNIAKVLKFTLLSPKPAWITRKTNPSADAQTHTLTIVNPDGQKAEWMFSIAGPTAELSASGDGQTTVNGGTLTTKGGRVTFDATKSRAESGALAYRWLVDGIPVPVAGTGPQLEQTFLSGSHVVTVEVTDVERRTDTASVTVVVS